jgi:tRNA modification GTPase
LHGEPNVGKSSLINALAETSVAIVSDCAGTTRDYVTCPFAWHDIEGLLVDTAGVAAAGPDDMLSAAAQDMSAREYHQADLELLCLDAGKTLSAWERAAVEHAHPAPRLVVWTKIDAATNPEADQWGDAWTSSRTGAGIAQLRELIATRLAAAPLSTGEVATTTAQRCRHSLELAAEHVEQAQQLWTRGEVPELVAWELRETLSELGQVVGAVYTEDLLDRVFSRFCIGK